MAQLCKWSLACYFCSTLHGPVVNKLYAIPFCSCCTFSLKGILSLNGNVPGCQWCLEAKLSLYKQSTSYSLGCSESTETKAGTEHLWMSRRAKCYHRESKLWIAPISSLKTWVKTVLPRPWKITPSSKNDFGLKSLISRMCIHSVSS